MQFIIDHTTLSFGFGDIPALLALLAVIVVFVVRYRKMKKEEKALEEQLALLYAQEASEDVVAE